MKSIVIERPLQRHKGIAFDFGWGNGYALIPKGHPCWGKDYNDECFGNIDVNGGLTFAQEVDNDLISQWSELKPKDKGYWIVGFDTAHYGDTLAKWPKEKVEIEAKRLAKQLSKIKGAIDWNFGMAKGGFDLRHVVLNEADFKYPPQQTEDIDYIEVKDDE